MGEEHRARVHESSLVYALAERILRVCLLLKHLFGWANGYYLRRMHLLETILLLVAC